MTARKAASECKFCEAKKEPGRRLCKAHLKSERDKIRDYRANRKAQGLCWRCDNPCRPGGVLCEDHRAEVREQERRQRENSKKKVRQKKAS